MNSYESEMVIRLQSRCEHAAVIWRSGARGTIGFGFQKGERIDLAGAFFGGEIRGTSENKVGRECFKWSQDDGDENWQWYISHELENPLRFARFCAERYYLQQSS